MFDKMIDLILPQPFFITSNITAASATITAALNHYHRHWRGLFVAIP